MRSEPPEERRQPVPDRGSGESPDEAANTGEQRLHPAAMAVSALGELRRWAGIGAFPGLAALLGSGLSLWTLMLVVLGTGVAAAGSAIWGFLSWRATSYSVRGGTFHMRSGVIQKSERSLPLEHVQSVNTVQGILQRLFGVVAVHVEAAGGGGEPEVSLAALSRGAAGELRAQITAARRSAASPGAVGPVSTVLRRLNARGLLAAGLTSGQFGIAASLVAGVSQTVDDLLPGDLFERAAEFIEPGTALAVVLFVAAVAAFAWLLSILGTVLTLAGFTLSRSSDGKYLHVRRGLLSRYETTVPLARIQAIRVVEGILRQPFGLAALRVDSAGFAEEGGVSTTLFPLLPRREVPALLHAAVPEFAATLDDLEPLPARARGRYVLRGAFIALPVVPYALAFAYFLSPLWALLMLLFVPSALYGLLRHRDAGWSLDRERLILRFRRLARTTIVAPRRRLQTRGFSVSLFQRWRGLVTLRAEVVSGGGGAAFRLADIDDDAAYGIIEALGPRAANV